MADEFEKNPNEQSGQSQKQPGQYPDTTQKDQQDPSKRNPGRQGQDDEIDDQQQGGQRRAS